MHTFHLYTRVSTAMQIDGYSLEAQKTKMKAFCDYNEYEIAGEYEDSGKSGKSIEGRIAFNQMIQTVDFLEELCEKTDMLILSLPKTKDTDVLIDAQILKLLKGKYLVNVGRSNCIDQEALYKALETKQLTGAAIDTWDKKPGKYETDFYPTVLPFEDLENIVLSPHQAMKVDVGHDRYVMDILQK